MKDTRLMAHPNPDPPFPEDEPASPPEVEIPESPSEIPSEEPFTGDPHNGRPHDSSPTTLVPANQDLPD